jgi:uncharacterized protein
MLFAIICTDKPNQLDLRLATRSEHVAYLKSLNDKAKLAGPFLDDAEDMNGTLVIVDAADRAAAQVIADNDPYAKAGLFQTVDIRAWRWALKNPEAV